MQIIMVKIYFWLLLVQTPTFPPFFSIRVFPQIAYTTRLLLF